MDLNNCTTSLSFYREALNSREIFQSLISTRWAGGLGAQKFEKCRVCCFLGSLLILHVSCQLVLVSLCTFVLLPRLLRPTPIFRELDKFLIMLFLVCFCSNFCVVFEGFLFGFCAFYMIFLDFCLVFVIFV